MSLSFKKALIVAGLIPLAVIATWFTLYAIGFRYYGIPTGSMEPIIMKNSHVFGRVSEGYRDNVNRFDVAVYERLGAGGVIYAKRIIGLGGEHIKIADRTILINGKPLSLPKSINLDGLILYPCDFTIPVDAVFILGDNTLNSLDSRQIGPIAKKDVLGKIFLRE